MCKMEKSFTNYRLPDQIDSDESDESFILTPSNTPEKLKHSKTSLLPEESNDSSDDEYQTFDKIPESQSSTRIYRRLRDESNLEQGQGPSNKDTDAIVIDDSDLEQEQSPSSKNNGATVVHDSDLEQEQSPSNKNNGATVIDDSDLEQEQSPSNKNNDAIVLDDTNLEQGQSLSNKDKDIIILDDSCSEQERSRSNSNNDDTDLEDSNLKQRQSSSNKDKDIIVLDNSNLEQAHGSFTKVPVMKSSTSTILQTSESDHVETKFKVDIGERIRIQQLLAEQKRLELEMSRKREEIKKTETTFSTANISVLPDKGKRLLDFLDRLKASLRDLKVQEKILNEKLQETPDDLLLHFKRTQEQPKQFQQPQWSSYASAAVNTNEMGKRALETHRTQQALTMDALTRLHNSLKTCPSEEMEAEDPKHLTVNLMPHQKHALAWLLWREKEKPSGGILADDMGLGKTLTMISLILKSEEEKVENADSKDEGESADEEKSCRAESNWQSTTSSKKYLGETLIVCPATLIGQWEREIGNKLKPGLLRVEMYHGTNRLKKESRLCRRDIVITTYNIVARENGGSKEKGTVIKGPVHNIRWKRIILDEAHQIRNHKSQTALAVYNLRAKYRWAVTGTPIHNKELDLYSLLKFIRCSPFDDLAVWKRWVDNRDAAGSQRLSTLVKTLMLRRSKEDLQSKGSLSSLPAKKFSTVEVKLSPEEFKIYQKILEFSKTLLAQYIYQKAEKEDYFSLPVNSKAQRKGMVDEMAFSGHPDLARLHKRMKNMTDVKTSDILVLLLRLRQICCHPYLIKSMLIDEEVKNVGVEDNEGLDLGLLEKMGDLTLIEDDDDEDNAPSPLSEKNPIFDPKKRSSKVEAVLNILEEHVLQTEDKAVIVSQWSSMLDLIYEILKLKKIKCVLLTGSVPVKLRGGIVEDFNKTNTGPKVMLLSLTAGGVGLNLVGANHLLMIDLHWNPQMEAQACDRIYRVGQKKRVNIYKFLCIDTIEERILKLQEMKLSLAQNVLMGTNIAQASKLSLEDLKMLFNIN